MDVLSLFRTTATAVLPELGVVLRYSEKASGTAAGV